jgi:phosphoribosylformimino-5-aminoimidazole carboxamide ribotide isomerase
MLMDAFAVYPAIDLRSGLVVRLSQGDPARQTVYDDDPGAVAQKWLAEGARWLHIVNLDGAFGDSDILNRGALQSILEAADAAGGERRVQFGGGLRSLSDVEQAIAMGVSRVIIGTAAIETPALVTEAIARFGAQRVGVGVDARENQVRVRGWTRAVSIDPVALGKELVGMGVGTIVFTNIARDGVGTGVDVAATQHLAQATGLSVIASGGVASLEDVRRVRGAGLSGVIIGRALYDGTMDLGEVLTC